MYRYRVVTTDKGRYRVELSSIDNNKWSSIYIDYFFKRSAIRAMHRYIKHNNHVPKVVYGPYP